MKKIAVGDLGEFWYGDYKEPFEQLEGGVPGHPVGVVLKDDDGKIMCAYCGKTFDGLGRHVSRHGLTADTYKEEVGLLRQSSLVSERVRMRMIQRAKTSPTSLTTVMARPWLQRAASLGGAAQGTPEHLNRTGRCYAQVLAVGRALLDKHKRLSVRHFKGLGIGIRTVERYFGSWAEFQKAVNAPVFDRRTWSTVRLLEGLSNVAKDLGRTPCGSDLRRFGLPTARTYQNRFGTYAEACRRAGLDPNLPVPDGEATDLSVLVAFATYGNVTDTGKHLGIGTPRITATLGRYGAPFAGSRTSSLLVRRAWAADMARRLAGTTEDAA